MNRLSFEAFSVISELKREANPPEFGLRLQGLFAHTLIRMGARILDIRPQGHPDIIADMGGEKWQFEVELIGSHTYQVKEDDLEGIRPRGPEWRGFLALLDCCPFLSWLVLRYKVLVRVGNGRLPIALLRIRSDPISSRCTKQFCSLVIENKDRLRNLNFHLLRQWALSGQSI